MRFFFFEMINTRRLHGRLESFGRGKKLRKTARGACAAVGQAVEKITQSWHGSEILFPRFFTRHAGAH